MPPVAELADAYDTSRATVTKALRKLAAEGLVTIVPNWGTFRAED
jgi:DNA-binding GntR family transcriptional regulator